MTVNPTRKSSRLILTIVSTSINIHTHKTKFHPNKTSKVREKKNQFLLIATTKIIFFFKKKKRRKSGGKEWASEWVRDQLWISWPMMTHDDNNIIFHLQQFKSSRRLLIQSIRKLSFYLLLWLCSGLRQWQLKR